MEVISQSVHCTMVYSVLVGIYIYAQSVPGLSIESPGLNRCYTAISKFVYFSSPRRPSPVSCVNEYLVIESGGNVRE